MQVEIKDFLNDIKWFADNLVDVSFMLSPSSFVKNTMPQIDKWRSGLVVLTGRSVVAAKEIEKRLAKYGVEIIPQTPGKDLSWEWKVYFKCKADDDIILFLSEVLKRQKLNLRSRQLNTLALEADQVAELLPQVHSSAFSRGVNALKHRVKILKNIRTQQIKDLAR